MFNAKSYFIDYSSFPLEALQKGLRKLRELKAEGFPIDDELIKIVSTEIIDRKIGFKPGAD